MDDTLKRAWGFKIDTPIEFFCKCWENVIQDTETGGSNCAVIDNPRFILKNIDFELAYNPNSEKRKRNITKYTNLYNKLISKHPYIDTADRLSPTDNEENKQKEIKRITNNYNKYLFDKTCEYIIDEIEKCNRITYEFKQRIEQSIKILVYEFLYKDYGTDYIKQLPKNPKSIITNEYGEVILSPPSFETINCKDFESEKEYKEALSKYLKERSIRQRINIIKECYHNNVGVFTVCYRVTGLHGIVNTSLGKVKLISELPNHDNSHLLSTKKRNYIYAVVDIEAENPETAIIKGLHIVENAVCFLTIIIHPTDPFRVSADNAVVFQGEIECVDKSEIKNECHRSEINYYTSVDISHYISQIENTERLMENFEKGCICYTNLTTSLYWYRKAHNTNDNSDKLLFSWIAMEVVFKECSKTEEIAIKCANIIVPHLYYSQWFSLYMHIRHSIDAGYIDIPNEIKEKAELNQEIGHLVSRNNFLLGLADVEHIIYDELLKTEIHKTMLLYSNVDNFNDLRDGVIKDLSQIHIIRNMMVHYAILEDSMIHIYANKAFDYCTCVLNGILHKMNTTEEVSSLPEMIDSFDKENLEKLNVIKNEIKESKV